MKSCHEGRRQGSSNTRVPKISWQWAAARIRMWTLPAKKSAGDIPMLVFARRTLLLLALSAFCCYATAEEFSLVKTNEGVTVNLDGELFTKYVVKSGAKPILWPIIGPTGKPMTRAYPMVADAPGED